MTEPGFAAWTLSEGKWLCRLCAETPTSTTPSLHIILAHALRTYNLRPHDFTSFCLWSCFKKNSSFKLSFFIILFYNKKQNYKRFIITFCKLKNVNKFKLVCLHFQYLFVIVFCLHSNSSLFCKKQRDWNVNNFVLLCLQFMVVLTFCLFSSLKKC